MLRKCQGQTTGEPLIHQDVGDMDLCENRIFAKKFEALRLMPYKRNNTVTPGITLISTPQNIQKHKKKIRHKINSTILYRYSNSWGTKSS